MKKIDIDKLTANNLVDYAVLATAFKKYLMQVLFYDEFEADFVVSTDFENPYDTPFIMQDYEGTISLNGKEYEVRSCKTEFCSVGLFHLASEPPFEFYMLIDLETLPDNTVASYRKARKVYVV